MNKAEKILKDYVNQLEFEPDDEGIDVIFESFYDNKRGQVILIKNETYDFGKLFKFLDDEAMTINVLFFGAEHQTNFWVFDDTSVLFHYPLMRTN